MKKRSRRKFFILILVWILLIVFTVRFFFHQAPLSTGDVQTILHENWEDIQSITDWLVHSEYETIYCYSDEERREAIRKLQPNPEITRFKGLGEIDSSEFKNFIGPDMRLDQVTLSKSDNVSEMLSYYMGKNTPERQKFIIDNLVVEEDKAEDLESE